MMTRVFLALTLGLAGLAATPTPSPAQTGAQCAERSRVVDILAQKFGETRRSIGIATNNTVMEVYASAETGTWTVAVTMPNGVTCLMASGQGYQATADELPAMGDPA